MRVSKNFIKDFAFLANFYEWSPKEIEEIKQEIREAGTEMVYFWSCLANAIINGYAQTRENNYIRLENWWLENGMTNLFAEDK